MATAHVLDEGVSHADRSDSAKLFEAAHRPQSSLWVPNWSSMAVACGVLGGDCRA